MTGPTTASILSGHVGQESDSHGTDEWSGDFLNYLTMSRIDALRKVLYGGYRYVDTATETVLMRSYIPQDAHAWGKEYESITRDGYDIQDYTPLDLPVPKHPAPVCKRHPGRRDDQFAGSRQASFASA